MFLSGPAPRPHVPALNFLQHGNFTLRVAARPVRERLFFLTVLGGGRYFLADFFLTRFYFRGYNNSMKKRMGRPRKAANERLSETLRPRITKEEHRKLRAKARRAGLTLSAYIRRKLLGE